MARRDADFYPTTPCAGIAVRRWLAERYPHHLVGGTWLDPAAGPGLLLEYVVPLRYKRKGIELQECFAGELHHRAAVAITDNALNLAWFADNVLMNPPFSLATEFVRAGLTHTRRTGGLLVALLRTGWLQAASRLDVPLPTHLLLLTWRPSFDGSGQTDTFSYAWMIWDPAEQLHFVERLTRPLVPAAMLAEHQRLARTDHSLRDEQPALL